MLLLAAASILALAIALLFLGRGYWAWVAPAAIAFAAWGIAGAGPFAAFLAVPFAVLAIGIGVRPLRARLVAPVDAPGRADAAAPGRDRADRARGRNRVVGRRVVLGCARMAQAARLPPAIALDGRTRLPRRPRGGTVPAASSDSSG